jgi:LPS-assembly protein
VNSEGRTPNSEQKAASWRFLIFIIAFGFSAAAAWPQDTVSLKAKKQQWVQDSFWTGEGDVEIVYQDITLKADRAYYDLANATVQADGRVELTQKDTRLQAESIHFSLKDKTGTLIQARADFRSQYFFVGEKVEKVGENRYKFFDGEFTSCEGDSPSWSFRIDRCTLETEGYAYLTGTSFRLHRVPVFYLPYMIWPTKRERSAGLLVPTFGHNYLRGSYLGLSYFQPFGDRYDTTLHVDLFNKGRPGYSGRFRYAPAEGVLGEISGYSIIDQDGTHRWKARWAHTQKSLPFGMALDARLEGVSDVDFFKEFEDAFDRNTQRQLYSYVSTTGTWGNHSLIFKADRRETFVSSTSKILLQQCPKAELRFRPLNLFDTPLSLSYQARFNLFNMDKGGNYRGTYWRADAFPTLAYSFSRLPWLSVSPEVGYRATYYSKTLAPDQSLVDESLWRTYLSAGAQVSGPRFSRLFTLGSATLKHLIEPVIQYTELSHLSTGGIPVSDEYDTVMAQQQVRYSLVNRVLKKTKSGSAEAFILEVAQRMSLKEDQPLTRLTRDGKTLTSTKGPLEVDLRITPSTAFYVDTRLQLNAITDQWENLTVLTNFAAGGNTLNLSYTTTKPQTPGVQKSEYTRATVSFTLWKKLKINGGASYDLARSLPAQQEYVLTWLSGCYTAALEYRDFRSGTRMNREYRIVINLRNVGSFLNFRADMGTTF